MTLLYYVLSVRFLLYGAEMRRVRCHGLVQMWLDKPDLQHLFFAHDGKVGFVEKPGGPLVPVTSVGVQAPTEQHL
jgi:hypothetical protein